MLEKPDRETKKELAKIGMTVTLAVTVITAPLVRGNRVMKNVHTGAGLLLTGFCLWHHFLYQPEKKQAKAALTEKNPSIAPPTK